MSKTAEDCARPESVSHSSINFLNDTDIDVKEDEDSKICHQIPLVNLDKGKLNHLKPRKIISTMKTHDKLTN